MNFASFRIGATVSAYVLVSGRRDEDSIEDTQMNVEHALGEVVSDIGSQLYTTPSHLADFVSFRSNRLGTRMRVKVSIGSTCKMRPFRSY